MKEHGIAWLNMPGFKGETWNPVVGCSLASVGCRHCYAEAFAVRLAAMGNESYQRVVSGGKWSGETVVVDEVMNRPLRWRKPRMVFVCSMGDLFHWTVTDETLRRVYWVMRACPQHVFCLLTKRPERMRDFLNDMPLAENVWAGVTAENQWAWDNRVIECLLTTKAAVWFVSVEPMLEGIKTFGIEDLDWVICGGESGLEAREMRPAWAAELMEDCVCAGVPFFMKQMSGFGRARKDVPGELMLRQWPVADMEGRR